MTTQDQDETFDRAYSKLEFTIRNFNREKISLESNIAQQNLTIKSYQSNIEELRRSVQKLEIEKQEAENVRKRDEEYRCSVEAALIESEKKIDAYYTSLRQFETIAQGINNHIETFENVMQTCKYRQVELLDHIFTSEEIHLKDRNEYKDKIRYLEKQLATNEESANCKQTDLEEGVKNLNLEINQLKSSLDIQKTLFENASKAHDIIVENLHSSHANQVLEKDLTLSDVKQKYETVEFELNATLKSKNILLEEDAAKIANLEDEICKLKLCLEDQKNKFENASINHRKVVDDICLERRSLLQGKDDLLAAQQKRASEVEDLLNGSLKKMTTQLESEETQVKELELEVAELKLSVQNCRNELEDMATKNITATRHFQNLSNDYQNQIGEKNVVIGDLECKLAELEKQMNVSLSESNQQCEDYVHDIKNLETNIKEMRVTIANIEKGMTEKDGIIVLQAKKIEDDERTYAERNEQLQINLNHSKGFIEETDAKVDCLILEIKELQFLLQSEKEKLENATRVHDEYVNESTNELLMKMKEKENELSDLEKKMIEKEGTWTSFREDVYAQLELSSAKIKDLETQKSDLQTSLTVHEKELQEKCREHSKTLEKLTLTNQSQMKEKDDVLNELQLKLSQLELDMSSSAIAAKENLEKSCAKIKELEGEMEIRKSSIETLNQMAYLKDETILSLLRDVEKLKRNIEEHRERAMENYKSFREVSIAKEKLEETYGEKLCRARNELHSTREELSKLKVMYENKELAITKFLNETQTPTSCTNQLSINDRRPSSTISMKSNRQANANEKLCKENKVEDGINTVFMVVPPCGRPSMEHKSSNPLKTFELSKSSNSVMKTKSNSNKEPRNNHITKLKQVIRETAAMDENLKRLSQSQSPRSNRPHNSSIDKTKDPANKLKVISQPSIRKKGILKTTMKTNNDGLEKRNVTFNSPIALFKSPPILNENEFSEDQKIYAPVSTDKTLEVPARTTCKRNAPDWILDPTGKSKMERCSNT